MPERGETTWDVFISYASEDREAVASPLAQALSALGVSVWYDRTELKIGDSLRESIDRGLERSRYGIVVLSPSFFAKHYPQLELNGLAQKELSGRKVLLPVWHRVGVDDVRQFSPPLADRIAAQWVAGPASVIAQLLEIVRPDLKASLSGPNGISAAIFKAPSFIDPTPKRSFPAFRDVIRKQGQVVALDERPLPWSDYLPEHDAVVGWGVRLTAHEPYKLDFELRTNPDWPELECVFYQRAPIQQAHDITWKRLLSTGAAISPGETPGQIIPYGEDWLVTCWGKSNLTGSAPWRGLLPSGQDDHVPDTLTLYFAPSSQPYAEWLARVTLRASPARSVASHAV